MKKTFFITFLIIGTVLFAGCSSETETTEETTTPSFSETESVEAIEPSVRKERAENPAQGGSVEMGERPELDLTDAAETLGVTVEELESALGVSEGTQPPNPEGLAEAAEELGVTVEELQEALGTPPEGGRPAGQRPEGGPQDPSSAE